MYIFNPSQNQPLHPHELLLLSIMNWIKIRHPILDIKLNPNLIIQLIHPPIQPARLNTSHLGHNLQFSVQSRATIIAEKVLVDFSRVGNGVIALRMAWPFC